MKNFNKVCKTGQSLEGIEPPEVCHDYIDNKDDLLEFFQEYSDNFNLYDLRDMLNQIILTGRVSVVEWL